MAPATIVYKSAESCLVIGRVHEETLRKAHEPEWVETRSRDQYCQGRNERCQAQCTEDSGQYSCCTPSQPQLPQTRLEDMNEDSLQPAQGWQHLPHLSPGKSQLKYTL